MPYLSASPPTKTPPSRPPHNGPLRIRHRNSVPDHLASDGAADGGESLVDLDGPSGPRADEAADRARRFGFGGWRSSCGLRGLHRMAGGRPPSPMRRLVSSIIDLVSRLR